MYHKLLLYIVAHSIERVCLRGPKLCKLCERLVGVAFEVSRWHAKLHAFSRQLMGGACRMLVYKLVMWSVLQQIKS